GRAKWCFMWCGDQDEQVTITLPKRLEGNLPGTFDLSSGRLTADGDFDTLTVNVAAGTFTYTGATPMLEVALSAGAANLTVTDTKEADLGVSAGTLTANLQGAAPERVRAEL